MQPLREPDSAIVPSIAQALSRGQTPGMARKLLLLCWMTVGALKRRDPQIGTASFAPPGL